MFPSLCGKQVVGPSSLPVVVAQSDERHANKACGHTHELGIPILSGCETPLLSERLCANSRAITNRMRLPSKQLVKRES